MTINEVNRIIFEVRKKHWPKKVYSFSLETDGSTWWCETRHAKGSGETPIEALCHYCLSARSNSAKNGEDGSIWEPAIAFLVQHVKTENLVDHLSTLADHTGL